MENNIKEFEIKIMCDTLEISRSSFYYYCEHNISERKLKDKAILDLIKTIWLKSHKRYGAPKITYILRNRYNITVSRRKVQKIMQVNKISSITKKSYRPKRDKPNEGIFNNLLNRNFKACQINEKWVSDITYINTLEYGWCYLATIMDLYSKRLIGWKFSKRMTAELVEDALYNALETRGLTNRIILHSDQGSQYTSELYRKIGEEYNINLSYSSKGCPYDNAPMESFNAIIKTELVNHTVYETFDQAYYSIFQFIEKWYNRERMHGSINYMTPVEFETVIQA